MTGTFGDFDAIIGGGEFAPDPLFVLQAESGLGCDFLREEPIRGGGRDTSRRSVRLVEKSAVLQIRHDVADCRRAQCFFEPLGNGARRNRLSCLDIRSDKVGQNLAVAPFLKRCVSHSSTPARRVLTTIVGSLSSPGQLHRQPVDADGQESLSIDSRSTTRYPEFRYQSALSICARWSLSE